MHGWVSLLWLFSSVSIIYCYDCNAGYCLPQPENFLQPSDLRPQRTVSVSSVCGQSLDNRYVKFPDTGDPTVFVCDGDDHQLEKMFDDDPTFSTYWQSQKSVLADGQITEQFITLNLTHGFAIRSVLIGFTSPHVSADELSDVRPKALVIERWTDGDFVAWQYYSYDCSTTFPHIPYQPINGPAQLPTIAVCKEQYFSGDTTTRQLGKPHQFVLYSPFADYDSLYIRNETIQDYFSTSSIRIRLVEPSDLTQLASYYAVSTLQVNGSCSCYGHADQCTGLNNEVCACHHNTQGDQCSECEPLYNAESWRIATDIDPAHCERCDCNGNAAACIYNQTLDLAECVDCTKNSYGRHCDLCVDGYFSDSDADKNTVCQECACTGLGVNSDSGSVSVICNSTGGQCPCKDYVTGRSCDQCQDGYWNLTRDNSQGCQECNCSSEGTLGSAISLCDKLSGHCMCKANVIGEFCDACKPLTFNLTSSNEMGCTECSCLTGASLSHSCENDIAGQCSCIDNIGGKTCDTPLPGYFIPKMDYLALDSSTHNQITVVGTGEYTILSTVSVSAGVISTIANTTHLCPLGTNQTVYDGVTVCLVADVLYTVTLTLNTTLTFIPRYSELLNSTEGQICLSQILSARTERSQECTVLEYTVMAELYGAALECSCDELGSETPDLCDPYSGQCYCKPGVIGQSCDRCDMLHYNMSSQGCTACECNSYGSDSLHCNEESGTCSCLPNVVGDKCDACLPHYYGLMSGSGCTQCQCSQYSVDNSCDDNGSCECKSGVEGRTCDICQPGYHMLSDDGCSPCGCDSTGSSNISCPEDGTCQCKPQVTGEKCDQCNPGFYRLWHGDMPCKMCYCSGHTFSCQVQIGWSKVTVSDRWSLLDQGVLQPRWSIVDSQGVSQATTTEIYHHGNDVQEINVFVSPGGDDYYYKATRKYLGDLRAAYYKTLNFTVSYTPANSTRAGTSQVAAILQGNSMELSSLPLSPPSSDSPTVYSLRLSESNFYNNNTGRRATLPEMLHVLDNVTDILIPGSIDQVAGSTIKLYAVSLETGELLSSDSDQDSLSNVAVCDCPTGYQGDRCEFCVDGYRREPRGLDTPTSQCVPCSCSSQSCDRITGQCLCTNNTTGERCDRCVTEYYGDPSNGVQCRECTCYGTENITCEMEVDGLQTCLACAPGHQGRQCESCADGFFGIPTTGSSTCQPCDCNGNSDTCDPITGVCIDCQNNTGGDNCEICEDGYYGEAAAGCRECNCTTEAGYDSTCDRVSGDCSCLLGLDIETGCNVCLPGHYNPLIGVTSSNVVTTSTTNMPSTSTRTTSTTTSTQITTTSQTSTTIPTTTTSMPTTTGNTITSSSQLSTTTLAVSGTITAENPTSATPEGPIFTSSTSRTGTFTSQASAIPTSTSSTSTSPTSTGATFTSSTSTGTISTSATSTSATSRSHTSTVGLQASETSTPAASVTSSTSSATQSSTFIDTTSVNLSPSLTMSTLSASTPTPSISTKRTSTTTSPTATSSAVPGTTPTHVPTTTRYSTTTNAVFRPSLGTDTQPSIITTTQLTVPSTAIPPQNNTLSQNETTSTTPLIRNRRELSSAAGNDSIVGCIPCYCNTDGTVNNTDTCDSQTGQCNCISHVTGRDCSVCDTGFYGKTPLLCTACDCDIEGTVTNTTCDTVTGQCMCVNDNVTGRRCSKCLSNTEGDFPSCTPCGECYDGWKVVLSDISSSLDNTFYQLRNLSAQYAGYAPEEIESIVNVVERNISQAQHLYMSAVLLLNTTQDVRLGFLLAHSSLDQLNQTLSVLTVQYEEYYSLLQGMNMSYVNMSIVSSLDTLRDSISKLSENNSVSLMELADRRHRMNATIHNLTQYQETSQILQQNANSLMERLSSKNGSLIATENLLANTLMETLSNVTYTILRDNSSIQALQSTLDEDRARVTQLSLALTALNTTSSQVESLVMSSYSRANQERVQTDSLTESVQGSRESVQRLLTLVNDYVGQVGSLRDQLDDIWSTLNITEQSTITSSELLQRIAELSNNMTEQDIPTLDNMEQLLASIYERQLDVNDTEAYMSKVSDYRSESDSLLEDITNAESEAGRIVEQLESAERDLASSQLDINQTNQVISEDILPLQQSVNQTIIQIQKVLTDNGMKTTQVLNQIEVFQLLTNQIQECRENSTQDLLELNATSSLLYEQALNNSEIMSAVNTGQSQLFLRIQLQAMAVQSSQVTLAQSSNQQSALSQRIDGQRQQLADLLDEYRANEQTLESLESEINKAERQLSDYIDSLLVDEGSCEP